MVIKVPLKKVFLVCFLSFVMLAGYSYSQISVGKILGFVRDVDGIGLPDVSVELSSLKMMGVRSTRTNVEGKYIAYNLPPGIYTVRFTYAGFNPMERRNITVRVGAIVTVDATLTVQTVEEEVLVVSESPAIDVESTHKSSIMTKETLEMLPLTREGRAGFYQALAKTPGWIDSAYRGGSVAGADSSQNQFTMDGSSITSSAISALILYPHFDQFDELEVITTGVPAEYSGLTGGVVNIITKSGANKFQGSISYYNSPQFLVGDNNPDLDRWSSYESVSRYEFGLSLSGAIVKDKLWFFSWFNTSHQEYNSWQDDPEWPFWNDNKKGQFKLTYQINPKHRVMLNLTYYHADFPWLYPSPWVALESSGTDLKSEPGYFGNWTWMLSDKAFFEFKASHWGDYEQDMIPTHGGSLYDAPHFDEITGVLSGAPAWFVWWNDSSAQFNANLSYYAEDFLAGDHDFKFGVQYKRGLMHAAGGTPGNKYYFDMAGEPYSLMERNTKHYGGIIHETGAFVDDSWKVGDRLTLNLGARIDNWNCDIPSWPRMDAVDDLPELAPGIENVVVWTSISPRLGFIFQLTPDGKTALKGHYGRYYDAPAGWIFGEPGPGQPTTRWSQWIGNDWVLQDVIAAENAFNMDPDQKNPYADQFTVAIERELVTDFSVSVSYTHKVGKNLIGLEDQGGTYEEVQMVSPDNGQTYTVFNLVSPLGSKSTVQTNPEGYGFTYNGVLLHLTKRYSNNWMLDFSVAWNHSKGLNMASDRGGSQELWHSTFGSDPNDLVNAEGVFGYNREWLIKINGGFFLPYGFLVSASYTWQTGGPWIGFVRIPDLNQGRRVIIDKPSSNDRTHDSFGLLDLRIQKTFDIQKFKLQLYLDVYNALNDDSITGFRSTSIWSGNYQVPSRMNLPFRGQLGIRLEF